MDATEIKILASKFLSNNNLKSDFIPASTKSFSVIELEYLLGAICEDVSSVITEGKLVRKLERELARYVGTRFASMCNSGSSANLLALSALTSPLLGSRALQPGS